MMKKWMQGMLMVFYLLSITGMKLHVHFCGEVLSYLEWADDKAGTCDCEDESGDMDCCEDQFIQTPVQGAHVTAQVVAPIIWQPVVITRLFSLHSITASSYVADCGVWASSAPPPLPKERLSLIQVFRI